MQEAERIGRDLRASRTLGIFGDDEELDHIEMEYRLVLQVGFSEKVTRSFWKRVSTFDFKKLDELADHVYLHPTSLKFVVYTPGVGIKLEERPGEYASKVQDLTAPPR